MDDDYIDKSAILHLYKDARRPAIYGRCSFFLF